MSRLYYVCLFVLLNALQVFGELDEGCECFDKDGVRGTCVDIKRCLASVGDLKLKKTPILCSFKGKTPIICCTDCELVNDTSTTVVSPGGSYFQKSGQKAADHCLVHVTSLNYSCSPQGGLVRDLNETCYYYSRPYIAAAVGGYNAQRMEFPHMALLGYGDTVNDAQWLCGGSVISERFILTAAHCISSNAVGPVKYVALGILKRTDSSDIWQNYNVKRIIPHPQYKSPFKYHDIALLETETRIRFSSNVLPACLDTYKYTDVFATATGWGALGHSQPLADTLQVVKLQQFTDEECMFMYPPHRLLVRGYDSSIQLCYGDKTKIIDTCQGDSGGPLQTTSSYGSCFYTIIGVTSYGRACGFKGNAGMYTRVKAYVPWIESIVWP